jgi:hypothetical protein
MKMIASKYDEKNIVSFIKIIHEEAIKEFLRKGEMRPTMFLLHKDRTWSVADLTGFENDKDLFEVMVKAYQLDPKVDGTILLTEVWMIEVDAEKKIDVRPSESPDRVEALFYMAETKFGNAAARAEIVREGKKATALKPLIVMADGLAAEATGRLVGGTFKPPESEDTQA